MSILNKLCAVFFMITIVISCGDKEPEPITCPAEALHTIENATGTMVYLPCYEAWGVELDNPLPNEEKTIGASLNVNSDFQTEGMRVVLDACFYTFDLPLIIPDPMPWGSLYKMENLGLNEE